MQEFELISLRLHVHRASWKTISLGLLDQIQALFSVVAHIVVCSVALDEFLDQLVASRAHQASILLLIILSDDAILGLGILGGTALASFNLAIVR